MVTKSTPHLALPSAALVDEQLLLRVVGLLPDQPITIYAALHDDDGQRWQSQAQFRADTNGVVDLASQAPIAGSYDGVDSMGLFWSMALAAPESHSTPFRKKTVAPLTVTFYIDSAGEPLASASLQWLFHTPEVKRTPIRANGLAGTFFAPVQGGPYPGVLVFGGARLCNVGACLFCL